MMKSDKMQNMLEMMSKMPVSERMKMVEEKMGMCICQDCSTFKDCGMNMDCSMTLQKSLFCGMSGSFMPKTKEEECKCTSCQVASDMGMSMMNFPCMGKK